jgi:putative oxidoreductase
LSNAYYLLTNRLRPLFAVGYDVFDIAVRIYLAKVFFLSGLTKIRDFGATRALFVDEYHVPLLPPDVAAVLGTAGELAFPVLLVIGLYTRAAAAGLFFVNAMAVLSYWHVLKDLEPALAQHGFWGTLLLVPLLVGPGRIAFDFPLGRRSGVAVPALVA